MAKKGSKLGCYTRVCKRCQKLYRSLRKLSKICPVCNAMVNKNQSLLETFYPESELKRFKEELKGGKNNNGN